MNLKQAHTTLICETRGQGFYDVTASIARWLVEVGADDGVCTMLIRHTSASLTIQENADPDVLADLATALDRLAPRNHPWRHTMEGPDDMPAHIRSMLTGATLSIPVCSGGMMLGTWQGIYVAEHHDHSHRRELACAFQGTLRS
ncbi:MAG: secondary thiamine-phosphate synthase enzyme YjbQ [Hyphomicrobiaceae bacterium]